MPTEAPEPAPRWQGPHLGRILGAEAVLGAKAVCKAEVVHIHSFWHPDIGLAAGSLGQRPFRRAKAISWAVYGAEVVHRAETILRAKAILCSAEAAPGVETVHGTKAICREEVIHKHSF